MNGQADYIVLCFRSLMLWCCFVAAPAFAQTWFPACFDSRCGYIDASGSLAIPFQYESTFRFSEDYARVKRNRHYGMIRHDGTLAIAPKYLDLGDVSEGVAWARKRQAWYLFFSPRNYLLNVKTGELVKLPKTVTNIVGIVNGLSVAETKRGAFGYISPDGGWALPPKYRFADSFSVEGLALVMNESPQASSLQNLFPKNQYDFIDKTGASKIHEAARSASSFHEGLAPIYFHTALIDHTSYIDPSGAIVLEVANADANKFFSGVASASFGDGWTELIDRTGKPLLSGDTLQSLGDLTDKLIRIKADGLFGFIRSDGTVVLPPVLDDASDEVDGLAAGRYGNRSLYIDLNGQAVWSSQPLPPDWRGCSQNSVAAPSTPPVDAMSVPTMGLVSSIQTTLTQLSGLTYQKPIGLKLINAVDAPSLIVKTYSRQPVVSSFESGLLAALGQIPSGESIDQVMATSLANAEQAFYSDSDSNIYVTQDAPPFWRLLSLVHGLARALAEQNANQLSHGDPSIRDALLEGIAKVLTAEFVGRLSINVDSTSQEAVPKAMTVAPSPYVSELTIRSGLSGNWFISRARHSQYARGCPGDLKRVLRDIDGILPQQFVHSRAYWTDQTLVSQSVEHTSSLSIGAVRINALLQSLANQKPSLSMGLDGEDDQNSDEQYFVNANWLTASLISDHVTQNNNKTATWTTEWKDGTSAHGFAEVLNSKASHGSLRASVNGRTVKITLATDR